MSELSDKSPLILKEHRNLDRLPIRVIILLENNAEMQKCIYDQYILLNFF